MVFTLGPKYTILLKEKKKWLPKALHYVHPVGCTKMSKKGLCLKKSPIDGFDFGHGLHNFTIAERNDEFQKYRIGFMRKNITERASPENALYRWFWFCARNRSFQQTRRKKWLLITLHQVYPVKCLKMSQEGPHLKITQWNVSISGWRWSRDVLETYPGRIFPYPRKMLQNAFQAHRKRWVKKKCLLRTSNIQHEHP